MRFNVRLLLCTSLILSAHLCGAALSGGQLPEGGAVKVWDVSSGRARDILAGEGEITALAFSPDGQILAAANVARVITLRNLHSGRQIMSFKGHTGAVQSLAFSPGGKVLASGGWDRKIKIWDLTTGKEVISLQGHAEVQSIAFSPDGNYLASGGGDERVRVWGLDRVRRWELTPRKLVRTLVGHSRKVNSVAFSPDGAVLATGSDDKTVKLWEVSSGKLLFTLEGHTGPVETIAFSPRDGRLASGSSDQSVKIWSALGGGEVLTLRGHFSAVTHVAFSSDGKILSSGSYDRTIKLWDADTGRELRTLEGHAQRITSMAFSPDGRSLVSGGALGRSESATLHVFAVGAGSHFGSANLPNVNFAARDATDFAAALEKAAGTQFERVNVRTLINYEASHWLISSTFYKVIAEAKPQDVFVFFFAGHASADMNEEFGEETFSIHTADSRSISDVVLRSWLNKVEAQRQLVILETEDSRKGYTTFFKRLAKESETFGSLLKRDLFILASASRGAPLPRLKNHFLTHTLLEGLAGAAAGRGGELTVKSLLDYTKGRQSAVPRGLQMRAGEVGIYATGEDFQLGLISHRRSAKEEPTPQGIAHFSISRRASAGDAPSVAVGGPPRAPYYQVTSWPGPGGPQKPVLKVNRKGRDYALLVATDKYESWKPLNNPVADAKAIAEELKRYYGFETEVIENPTKRQVLDVLVRYAERKYEDDDQLFIFFAGHGSYLHLPSAGHLVFKDSRHDDKLGDSYLSYDLLARVLDGFSCKHIFLVIDACYGGTFGEAIARRGADDEVTHSVLIERRMQFMTRQFLTSGGKEYVSDGGKGRHSPFTRKLLEALRSYGGKDGFLSVKKVLVYVDGLDPIPHSGGWGKNEPGSDFFFLVRTP